MLLGKKGGPTLAQERKHSCYLLRGAKAEVGHEGGGFEYTTETTQSGGSEGALQQKKKRRFLIDNTQKYLVVGG